MRLRRDHESEVSKDHVVSLDGADYEVPSSQNGRISIERHLLSGRLTVEVDGETVEIHPHDPIGSAFDRRARRSPTPRASPTPKTAASESFDRAYGPIVSADGDYPNKERT